MNLQFSIVAEREIEEAADYYENEEAGLGLRFLNELSRSLELILQFPEAWSPLSKRSRRCVMRRFPHPAALLSKVRYGQLVLNQRYDFSGCPLAALRARFRFSGQAGMSLARCHGRQSRRSHWRLLVAGLRLRTILRMDDYGVPA